AEVPRPGRYQTGEGVLCLPAAARGAFADCGPEAALEAGPTLFGVLGAGAEAKVARSESVRSNDAGRSARLPLSRRPFLERVKSGSRALLLMSVAVPFGDRALPACRLGEGVRLQRDTACYAAAGLAGEAVARWWTAADAASSAEVSFLALEPPARPAELQPGHAPLSWSGALGRFAL